MAHTSEMERAREELAHHAADFAHMRRELQRLENVITRDLAEPVRVTAGLVTQLATCCGDELGAEVRALLDGLERSARDLQAVIERSA